MVETDNSLYRVWHNMIYRCYSPKSSSYKNYGGRGITVCDDWRKSFNLFLYDMGERPYKFTLDRINTNGNYEPSNCRWADKKTQSRNMRTKRVIMIDGVEYHVAELQEKYGVDMRTIHSRHQAGLPFEKVISKEKFYNNTESQKKAVQRHAELKRAQTHCKHGHELSGDNVYLYQNRRHCRKCRKATDRYLYYKKQFPLENFL